MITATVLKCIMCLEVAHKDRAAELNFFSCYLTSSKNKNKIKADAEGAKRNLKKIYIK